MHVVLTYFLLYMHICIRPGARQYQSSQGCTCLAWRRTLQCLN